MAGRSVWAIKIELKSTNSNTLNSGKANQKFAQGFFILIITSLVILIPNPLLMRSGKLKEERITRGMYICDVLSKSIKKMAKNKNYEQTQKSQRHSSPGSFNVTEKSSIYIKRSSDIIVLHLFIIHSFINLFNKCHICWAFSLVTVLART